MPYRKAKTILKTLFLFLFTCFSSQAAELLLVERDGCHYCAHWNKVIDPIYPNTDIGKKLPLKRMDLDKDKNHNYKFKTRIIYTPTFVVLENNVEIMRIEGFASEDFFWSRLEKFTK